MKAFHPWVMAVARGIMWLTLLAAMLLPAGLACASGRTVRVGYYMFDGYQMQDADGMRSGYGYDFLQELARYTGWQYEYVGYELGWAKLQQMLDAGEIDILTSARKTPQREQQYLFSSSMGTSAGILTVKTGDERLTMGDYATYAGIRTNRNAGAANLNGAAAPVRVSNTSKSRGLYPIRRRTHECHNVINPPAVV